ncbi:ATP phosphoribosyltransferase regulatory subunit [Hypericibacter adhaerens]|uniref:ATP phosphoribosyltransferase regulatory subunit n=1 Tax=Hypericibacter adhaerens TaxID=2602016 RepID=A0A5J6N983_9PROT|nr:ATP phosphoribosyltransferase regulatory subunit [Hypericibacter adhaerens]QEX23976.1 ATP phosphoribosyltransferase regulatory subunit [Hypericibacter adhaerens]
MQASAANALLPTGLSDLLPPDAAFEAAVVDRLTALFASQGYERIKPPLIEFETSLLAGAGAAMAEHTFRLMDPISHRMMGLRADMTPQVARIAATRLKNAPRPLRLSYAGQVLRVKGTELKPARQLGQVGIELIGAEGPAADAEVILLAAETLSALGLEGLTIDLNLPTLVPAAAAALGFRKAAVKSLVQALDRKDAAAVAAHAGRHALLFQALIAAAGPARRAIAALERLDLPTEAAEERRRLGDVVAHLLRAMPKLHLTIDPAEHRGFEYYNGVGFSLFARGARNELGRGGRYVSGEGEPSTGFSLYLDSLIQALPAPVAARRILLPLDTPRAAAAALRRQGWVTIGALHATADMMEEARRLHCSHVWQGGKARSVVKTGARRRKTKA